MDVTDNPALITSADANDTTLVIKSEIPNKGPEPRYAFIKVISGTFKFNVGKTADAATVPSWTSSDTVPPIPIDVSQGRGQELHFKAANAAETFALSIG